MTQQDVHDELRARLHETAEAYAPDRARILARVERGMARPDGPGHRTGGSPVWSWARVAGATAAVAGLLAAGGYAVASAVKDDTRRERTVAVSPTQAASPSPSPSPSSEATGRAPLPSATPGGGPAPEPSASSPAGTASADAGGERDGPLSSAGSIDPHSNEFWAQSDLTLRTTRELASLTVELKVAQTGGVTSTGAWRSLPEQDFTQTVREADGFVVYTWELRAGRTVPAGTWVFAGQYDHERGGRAAGSDRYTVTGTADGQRRSVRGGFAAPGGG